MIIIKPLKLKIMTKIKNLNEVLLKTNKFLAEGDKKMASVYCSGGIEECSRLHSDLNQETQGWDLKKAFDYKGKFNIQGKTLNNWMEKFWNIIEDNDLDLVYSEPITIENFKTILLYNKETKEQVYYTH